MHNVAHTSATQPTQSLNGTGSLPPYLVSTTTPYRTNKAFQTTQPMLLQKIDHEYIDYYYTLTLCCNKTTYANISLDNILRVDIT